jgi:hypothetical protein
VARRSWLLIVVAACGRIGFAPVGGDGDDNDDARDGGNGGDGSGQSMTDATTACTNAVPVPVGVRVASSTCVGVDTLDGCGPAGTREVIFVFDPPTSGSYQVRAFDAGTQNTSNSTGQLDAACKLPKQCAGVLVTQFTQGVPAYFVVESSTGGCVNIEFEVQ